MIYFPPMKLWSIWSLYYNADLDVRGAFHYKNLTLIKQFINERTLQIASESNSTQA